jgi:hypothetical protein
MYRDSEDSSQDGWETSVPGTKSVRQGEAGNDRNRWARRGAES